MAVFGVSEPARLYSACDSGNHRGGGDDKGSSIWKRAIRRVSVEDCIYE